MNPMPDCLSGVRAAKSCAIKEALIFLSEGVAMSELRVAKARSIRGGDYSAQSDFQRESRGAERF